MEAIARLGLFGSAYITVYIISYLVASNNTIDGTGIVFFENFHGVSFLLVTLLLGGWIYYIHFKDNEVPRNLREILYIFSFVCAFTSLAGFLGYC